MMADDLRWMTYDEAAKALNIKADSVRRRAASKKWPRRQGNDGLARVGLPAEIIPDATPVPTPAITPDHIMIRMELAEAQADVRHLTKQLEEMRQDRDRWHDLAEKLSEPRPGIFERIAGAFRRS